MLRITVKSTMLSVIMLGIVMLSDNVKFSMVSVIMLGADMLSVKVKSFMTSVIMLGADMLSVFYGESLLCSVTFMLKSIMLSDIMLNVTVTTMSHYA